MLDITPFIGYIKHKLIRFTGFRLSKNSGVWRFH